MRTPILFAIVAAAGAAACGSDLASAPTDSISPAYSVTVSGDRTGARSGISFTLFIPNGWREETNGGATKDSSDVTLVTLGAFDVTQPQTNIGLLGRPRVGTFRVRVPAVVTTGTVVTSLPASLDVSGTFVAKSP